MSSDFQLVHRLGDCVELTHAGQLLFRYVYVPRTAARESPKPFFHPLRTLAGEEITIFRPHDHPWHHGLAMTMAYLSGENFWGGPTYVAGQGYQQLPNNGRIAHRDWLSMKVEPTGVALLERLSWITRDGDSWIAEIRRIGVGNLEVTAGYWSLDLAFALTNVSGRELRFGSPTTQGRPLAGYGGLFWRGPRSFLGAAILADGGLDGTEVMGRAAPWLAVIGRHDGSGAASTLLFLDHPANPRYPTRWFVRNDPYACVSFSFMFDEEYPLAPAETLTLSYRVIVADGEWSRDQIESALKMAAVRDWRERRDLPTKG